MRWRRRWLWCGIMADGTVGRFGWLTCGLAGTLLALAPPFAELVMASLLLHVLVMIPLLVGAGIALALAAALPNASDARLAPAALLFSAFSLAFWTLPRWLDAAVANPLTALLRAAVLVILCGMPLAYGWTRAGPIVRAFAWSNLVSMLVVSAWLLQAAPDRLCNSYLVGEQRLLAWALLVVAVGIATGGALRVVAGGPPRYGVAQRPREGSRPSARYGPQTGSGRHVGQI